MNENIQSLWSIAYNSKDLDLLISFYVEDHCLNNDEAFVLRKIMNMNFYSEFLIYYRRATALGNWNGMNPLDEFSIKNTVCNLLANAIKEDTFITRTGGITIERIYNDYSIALDPKIVDYFTIKFTISLTKEKFDLL